MHRVITFILTTINFPTIFSTYLQWSRKYTDSERHGTEVPSTPSGRGEILRSAEALHHGQVHFGAGPPGAGPPLTHL